MNNLDLALQIAPYLTADVLIDDDIMVAITDTKNYLYYSASITMDAKIKCVNPFLIHDVFGHVSRKKQVYLQVSPPEYGDPFRAIGYPIFDEENKLIGGIGFGIKIGANISYIHTKTKFHKIFEEIFETNVLNDNLKHVLLNRICTACGKYGIASCASCPIEIKRQDEVMKQMKKLLKK